VLREQFIELLFPGGDDFDAQRGKVCDPGFFAVTPPEDVETERDRLRPCERPFGGIEVKEELALHGRDAGNAVVESERSGLREDRFGEAAHDGGEALGLGMEGLDLIEEERAPDVEVAQVAGDEDQGEVVEGHRRRRQRATLYARRMKKRKADVARVRAVGFALISNRACVGARARTT
jgi:hypothetical protein